MNFGPSHFSDQSYAPGSEDPDPVTIVALLVDLMFQLMHLLLDVTMYFVYCVVIVYDILVDFSSIMMLVQLHSGL